MDKGRFEDLWSRCCVQVSDATDIFAGIEQSYGEDHRYYHTGAHIDHCLAQLDLARSQIADADAVEMALWFHDVEYATTASDNELQSAERFRESAKCNMNPEFVDQVYRLIMVTIHDRCPELEDERYIVDIDLSSFGLPRAAFRRDSMNVRKEHTGLSDKEFASKNRRFLSNLLDRPSIYATQFFQQRYEETAQENMRFQVEELARIIESEG